MNKIMVSAPHFAPSPFVGEGWSELWGCSVGVHFAPSPLVGEGWGEGLADE